MVKFPYFPGCSLRTSAQNFESSALEVSKILGIDLIELEDWNCCGTVFNLTSDNIMNHLASVRNLIRVEEMNESKILDEEYRLVTFCSMCYNTLKRVNELVLNDREKIDVINQFMDKETHQFEGKAKVIHFLQLFNTELIDKIREETLVPLTGLNVAPYYGCLLTRPKEIAIDKPENPTILEELIQAVGATSVDYNLKMRCCGSYHTVDQKELVLDLTYSILTAAQKVASDLILVSCPLCAFNLDERQKDLQQVHPEFSPIPVLYFTQLLGIAFQIPVAALNFSNNWVDPIPNLQSYLPSELTQLSKPDTSSSK